MATLLATLGFAFFLLAALVLCVHFLPTIIAFSRHARGRVAILLVQLAAIVVGFIFSWTIIIPILIVLGWFGLLIWACVDRRDGDDGRVVQVVHSYAYPSAPPPQSTGGGPNASASLRPCPVSGAPCGCEHGCILQASRR